MNFIRKLVQKLRAIKNDASKCIYCGKCQKTCHHKAINVDKQNRSWVIDNEKCYRCGHCLKKCPVNALILEIIIP